MVRTCFKVALVALAGLAPIFLAGDVQAQQYSGPIGAASPQSIVRPAQHFAGPMDEVAAKPVQAPVAKITKVKAVTYRETNQDEPYYQAQEIQGDFPPAQEIIDRPVPEVTPTIRDQFNQAQIRAENQRRMQIEDRRQEQIELDRQRMEMIRRERQSLDLGFVPVVPRDVYTVFPANSPYAGMSTDLNLDESCCDEWDGFCRMRNLRYECACGGLKTNPGHWGLPWLRGCDNCEKTCGACSGKGVQARCGRSYFDQWRDRFDCRVQRNQECRPCTTSNRRAETCAQDPTCVEGCNK